MTTALSPPTNSARYVEVRAAHRGANGHSDALYEPLDHIQPGLPPTLIHVPVVRCCCTTRSWQPNDY